MKILTVIMLLTLGACGVVDKAAQAIVNEYCDEIHELERAALSSRINAVLAPHSLTIQCAQTEEVLPSESPR